MCQGTAWHSLSCRTLLGQPGNRHRRVYGRRSQAESAFSRHKRRLGSAVAGRSEDSRKRECYLRVLTHNLMLLAAAG
jgi:transposase